MHDGYVKLWRKCIDSGWLKNHKLWTFWSWCLMKASHREFKTLIGLQEINIYPGQFIFGLNVSCNELNMSYQSIRSCLKFLEKSENITIKTTNKFSIISIVNWNTYQSTEDANNKQDNKQITNQQQTNNNIQEQKNKRKKIKISSSQIFPESEIEPVSKISSLSNPDGIRLGNYLYNHIVKNKPNFKKPNIESWAKDFDLMIRVDNRSVAEIKDMIEWVQRDPFWWANILSPAKLRKQWDQLEAKKTPFKPVYETTRGMTMDEVLEAIR